MATLRAHGAIIGTLDMLTASKRYMSDGTVLRNSAGSGWKLHGKGKPGFSADDLYARALERLNAKLVERPALAAYRKALHAAAPLSRRWHLHEAVATMPDDPDGVWSVADDEGWHLDLEDVADLCAKYRAASSEGSV